MTVISTFAEQQLAKYGWKKGDGLGKDGDGIKRALTVSRRSDNRGIGSDANQWNSNWWDHLYNKASATTTTTPAISPEDAVYQEKLAKAAEEKDTLSEYQGMFVRSATDTPAATPSGTSTPVSSNGPVDRTKLVRDGNVHLGAQLTDAELFAACEGRTARKGARAEQNGKLARVAGLPRPEVAARIEAALSGRLPEQTEVTAKRKRKDSEDGESRKSKSSKSDKKRFKEEKLKDSEDKKERKKSKCSKSDKKRSKEKEEKRKAKKLKTKDAKKDEQ